VVAIGRSLVASMFSEYKWPGNRHDLQAYMRTASREKVADEPSILRPLSDANEP
jgi:hypothetical protein